MACVPLCRDLIGNYRSMVCALFEDRTSRCKEDILHTTLFSCKLSETRSQNMWCAAVGKARRLQSNVYLSEEASIESCSSVRQQPRVSMSTILPNSGRLIERAHDA